MPDLKMGKKHEQMLHQRRYTDGKKKKEHHQPLDKCKFKPQRDDTAYLLDQLRLKVLTILTPLADVGHLDHSCMAGEDVGW